MGVNCERKRYPRDQKTSRGSQETAGIWLNPIKGYPERGIGAVTLNLILDVPRLIAEVEELRSVQEQLRGKRESLKEKYSALITESNEHLREMEEFQAVVREVLKDGSEMDGSFNQCESPDQLDLALSVSTVGHSNGKQVRDGDYAEFNSHRLTSLRPLLIG